jgi:tRNA-dihydrouridine synthase B
MSDLAAGLPTELCIGDLKISPPLTLAPMENITDLPFRQLVRTIGGCPLMFTEFVASKSLNHGDERALRAAHFLPYERPIAVQVYGKEPDALAEAAAKIEQMGASIVDLNMGCPSKRVSRRSGGVGLMREPKLVEEIVRKMRAAVSIPLTVKMRSGWDADSRNAVELAKICAGEGAEMLTVHWRTKEDRYGGERDLSIISQVVESVDIPVLGNGDIVDVPSALSTLRETGCAGLMIGRGAVRNPWVFHEIGAELCGGAPPVVEEVARARLLLTYLEDIIPGFGTRHGALGRFKKIARYFTLGAVNGKQLQYDILHSSTIEEAREIVHLHFGL